MLHQLNTVILQHLSSFLFMILNELTSSETVSTRTSPRPERHNTEVNSNKKRTLQGFRREC